MNPHSADLENRGRTAESLCESKNDKELVWKDISLWVETLGRSRRWGAQKFRKHSRVLWIREKAKALCCDYQVIVWIACRKPHGALPA